MAKGTGSERVSWLTSQVLAISFISRYGLISRSEEHLFESLRKSHQSFQFVGPNSAVRGKSKVLDLSNNLDVLYLTSHHHP
jgi:hypothetical protein